MSATTRIQCSGVLGRMMSFTIHRAISVPSVFQSSLPFARIGGEIKRSVRTFQVTGKAFAPATAV